MEAGLDHTARDLLDRVCAAECWRPAPGYPGYEVSSHGRVRGKRVDILAQSETRGYLYVSLSSCGRVESVRVHRLVAFAFLGEPPFEKAEAAHNDGNKKRNWANNLRWTNALDNQADVERHGNRVRGSLVYGARLTEADVPVIRDRVERGERYAEIASDYGISVSTVSLIKLGKVWRHV